MQNEEAESFLSQSRQELLHTLKYATLEIFKLGSSSIQQNLEISASLSNIPQKTVKMRLNYNAKAQNRLFMHGLQTSLLKLSSEYNA